MKLHTSHIELNLSALKHNIRFIKDLLGDSVTFSSVVKGNAYGHGIEKFAGYAVEAGVRHFSTFSADEAYRILPVTGSGIPVMIMGMVSDEAMEWAIENEVEFFVFEDRRLNKAIEAGKRICKPARVHIELETGMNRTGFPLRQLRSILELMADHPGSIDFRGICTHFAGSESMANHHRVQNQQKRFRRVVRMLETQGKLPRYVHAACSAATIRYPASRHNMVRIGILQYGFFPSREIMAHYLARKRIVEFPLKRVISWKSRVMAVKEVGAGQFIGYGTSYFTNIDMRIAIVPVGYSHGFSRSLSNKGRVLIQGRRLPVIGTVNMSMMAIDVSELDSVNIGDEVVIVGNQGELEISIASFSDTSELVNYELLTRLPQDIPRLAT